MTVFNICYCANEQYLQYACISIFSILTSASKTDCKNGFIFHLITSSLSQEATFKLESFKARIEQDFYCVKIKTYEVDASKFSHYKGWGNFNSKSIYYRFLIPDLIDPNVEKVLYLDCDVICKGSLKPLFEMDFKDKAIIAIPDPTCESWWTRKLVIEHKYKILPGIKYQYHSNEAYVNSGVIMMDLQKWRAKNYSDKIYNLLAKYHTSFPDQDAINAVLKDDILLVDNKWNLMWGWFLGEHKYLTEKSLQAKCSDELKRLINYSDEALEKAVLIHFTTCVKPWMGNRFVITDGYQDKKAQELKKEFANFAYNTPVYGEIFSKLYHSCVNTDPIKSLDDFSEALGFWISKEQNARIKRLTNKIKRLKGFVITALSLQFAIILAILVL